MTKNSFLVEVTFNFEPISHLFLVFLLLALNKLMLAGIGKGVFGTCQIFFKCQISLASSVVSPLCFSCHVSI